MFPMNEQIPSTERGLKKETKNLTFLVVSPPPPPLLPFGNLSFTSGCFTFKLLFVGMVLFSLFDRRYVPRDVLLGLIKDCKKQETILEQIAKRSVNAFYTNGRVRLNCEPFSARNLF